MSSTLVTQLQHDKEVLERQLDEVSSECGRLQVWSVWSVDLAALGERKGGNWAC